MLSERYFILWRMNRKVRTNQSVPPSPTREEPAEIRQDMGTKSHPCRDPAYQNPTHEDKRRPICGRVGALFRHIFRCGKKKNKAVGDPEGKNLFSIKTHNKIHSIYIRVTLYLLIGEQQIIYPAPNYTPYSHWWLRLHPITVYPKKKRLYINIIRLICVQCCMME